MRKLALAVLRHKHFLDLAIFLLALPAYYYAPTQADQVSSRSLLISNVEPSANTSYQVSYTINFSSVIGSMELQFCSNSPLYGDVCTPPSGMDASSAVINRQTGITNWSIFNSTNNAIILTRNPGVVLTPMPVVVSFSGIVNPSRQGPYYARISTYSSNNGTGIDEDFGGDAFYITGTLSVSTYVPPYLIFCSGLTISNLDCATAIGNYINLGDLSYLRPSVSTSQVMAGSNSGTGYTIQVNGTTLTSGNNIIDQISSPESSLPGSAQFGMNLRSNTIPKVGLDPSGPGDGSPTPNYDQPNVFQFNPGDVIASTTQPDYPREYTISYLVNVDSDQAPGIYDGSLTYICVANF